MPPPPVTALSPAGSSGPHACCYAAWQHPPSPPHPLSSPSQPAFAALVTARVGCRFAASAAAFSVASTLFTFISLLCSWLLPLLVHAGCQRLAAMAALPPLNLSYPLCRLLRNSMPLLWVLLPLLLVCKRPPSSCSPSLLASPAPCAAGCCPAHQQRAHRLPCLCLPCAALQQQAQPPPCAGLQQLEWLQLQASLCLCLHLLPSAALPWSPSLPRPLLQPEAAR